MKKLLFTVFALSLVGFFSPSLAHGATAESDLKVQIQQQLQQLNRLKAKIQQEKALSADQKRHCIDMIEGQIQWFNGKYTSFDPSEKNEIRSFASQAKQKTDQCLQSIYQSRISAMQSKINQLKNTIKTLQNKGQDTSSLEATVKGAEQKLQLLKSSIR